MQAGSQNRVLRIQQGQELQFHVSRDICCEYSLLNPAYQQAQRALIEILRHTKVFHKSAQGVSNDEKELFEYGGNIILFAAPRGGGKTRMMLSFSHILECQEPANTFECLGKTLGEKECHGCKNPFISANESEQKWLTESSFLITEPIAPAALEKNQSILYVVLSRLYRYAEKLLKKKSENNITESQQNELRKFFHNCLSGINGLKRPSDSLPEDFSVLQDISDGLSLRYHFYRLITKLLEIASPYTKADHRYLVLQVDDADSKIDGVYEVFEDIRKYLLVPNLVILLSADLDFLHRTIAEEHLKRFESLQKFDKEYAQEYSGELSRVARKYIDKLIPPSHQINLPELGRMTGQEVENVTLSYLAADGTEQLLHSSIDTKIKWNLQNNILMLIYRKTGVLFISPSAYLHNIIPRTQRGLNQMLFILNEMADIPAIEYFNANPIDESKRTFISDVLKQVAVAQGNLARFSEYFIHDWIKVKIKDSDDRDFLNKFSSMANSELTYMTLAHLKKKYTNVEFADPLHTEMDRYALEQAILIAERSHRTPEDFLFFFAIRTLLTLNTHRLILQAKKKAVNNPGEKEPILFTFNGENCFLTSLIELKQLSPDENVSFGNIKSAYILSSIPSDRFENNKIAQLFSRNIRNGKRLVSYLNVFVLLLQLKDIIGKSSMMEASQKVLYQLQEYALIIVANWDVYGKIFRETNGILKLIQEEYKKDPVSASTPTQPLYDVPPNNRLTYLFNAIATKLNEFNGGTLSNIWPISEVEYFSEVLCELKISEKNLNGSGQKILEPVALLAKLADCLKELQKDIPATNDHDPHTFAIERDNRSHSQQTKINVNIDDSQIASSIDKLVDILTAMYKPAK